jgi:hypothetical protein
MKFAITDYKNRRINKFKRWQDQYKWHVHFAWLPVRLDQNTVVWLERVARRKSARDSRVVSLWRFSYRIGSQFDYGPITNVLMQSGVLDVGAGVSAAQASGNSVQSGSIAAFGQAMQNVQLSGNANACIAPPGGLNTSAPQPGP